MNPNAFRIVLNYFENGRWTGRDEILTTEYDSLKQAQNELRKQGFSPVDDEAPRCKVWVTDNVRANIYNRPEFLDYCVRMGFHE